MRDDDDPLCNCDWNDQFGHESSCLTWEQFWDKPLRVSQLVFKQIHQLVEDPREPTDDLKRLMRWTL